MATRSPKTHAKGVLAIRACPRLGRENCRRRHCCASASLLREWIPWPEHIGSKRMTAHEPLGGAR
eukprot:1448588-Alexandrium_andersonii.AAC.1